MSQSNLTTEDLLVGISALSREFAALIEPLSDEQSIRAVAAQLLGKKGRLSVLMKDMGKLPAPDRPKVGDAANRVKSAIEAAIDDKLAALAQAARQRELQRTLDVTLPGRSAPAGHLHLLTQLRLESIAVFAELGFVVAEGPQIEDEWHNFEALAIPRDHPARDAQDSFYLGEPGADAGNTLLRTHTSPVQVRTMKAHAPPIRMIAPGQVYRRDDDATHSPMFTQLEGLAVDEGLRLSDLKGVLVHYVTRIFGKTLTIRLRPSYFQFVEPGVEVDMQCVFCGGHGCRLCKGSGWIEIGGAGMVDPEVFAHVGVDSERFTGFAFGMGLERMAMLRHGVNDIKYYYEGDLRFLEQF